MKMLKNATSGVIVLLLLPATMLFAAVEHHYKGSKVNKERLIKTAIINDGGFGYKYANLKELEPLCAGFNDQYVRVLNLPYTFQVPKTEGIPSDKIQSFLLRRGKFDLKKRWAELIVTLGSVDDVVRQQKYPDVFQEKRLALETELASTFDTILTHIIENIQQGFLFSLNKEFDVSGIDELLVEIAQNHERLMVRSSGKEDCDELANAGGNESVSNVEPDAISVLKKMKKVITSYVSKKSLDQRLGATQLGTPLFDEKDPLTPVVIQRMIGEKNPTKVPKCGVMFTEEAEGGVSKYDSTQTTGITVIQFAYGHNEGVVNSRIPVDTYYVDENNNIYNLSCDLKF